MMRARFHDVLVLAGLTVVYWVAGKLGLQLAFVHPSATAVWPPSGLALAALLLLGYRVWPGIFIGAFLVNYVTLLEVKTGVAGVPAPRLGPAKTHDGVLGAPRGARHPIRPETVVRAARPF